MMLDHFGVEPLRFNKTDRLLELLARVHRGIAHADQPEDRRLQVLLPWISATARLNVFRRRLQTDRRTRRLPLSEWFSASASSRRQVPQP